MYDEELQKATPGWPFVCSPPEIAEEERQKCIALPEKNFPLLPNGIGINV